jgi:hypothetical protein
MDTPSWLKDYINVRDESQVKPDETVPPPAPVEADPAAAPEAKPAHAPPAQVAAAPELPALDDLCEPDDLARLTAALQAHAEGRSAPAGERDEREQAALKAVAQILILGPLELGTQLFSSSWRAQAAALARAVVASELPEAQACALWLACAAGEETADAALKFSALLRRSLWPPVRALAYRALGFFGQRKLLAELLAGESALTLDQADAWLEAAHGADLEADWPDRIADWPDELLPAEQRAQWRALLASEAALASVDPSVEQARAVVLERDLAALTALAVDGAPRTFAAAVTRRTAARAAAALARLRLALRRDDGSAITSAAGQLLPEWEREFLKALARWQSNNLYAATETLEEALRLNPQQTCLRLALAALFAPARPDAALQLLRDGTPSRESLVAMTALLARLGRFEEAERTLGRCAGSGAPGHEAARYSWARARRQYREREAVLRAALAEQRGDSNTANRAWRVAYAEDEGAQQGRAWLVDNLRKTLREVRQLLVTRRELEVLSGNQSWLRSVLQQRLKRGCYAVGKLSLEDDALFFRATTMVDVFPRRAARDFQSLLRQRNWVEKERRAAGGRIIFAGDMLLRLGRPADALNAYTLASSSPAPELKERLAVAGVFAEVVRQADAPRIADALRRAETLAALSPWPRLLAAVGLLLAGDAEAARAQLEAAAAHGADASLSQQLQSMCDFLSGAAVMPEGDIARLREVEDVRAVARLLCNMEVEAARVAALEQALGAGWLHGYALNPYVTSARLLNAWCDEANWDKALQYADELTQTELAWATELAALVRVRQALDYAQRGELDAADAQLQSLERLLEPAAI